MIRTPNVSHKILCSFHCTLKFQIMYPNCLLGISSLFSKRHLKHKKSQNKVLSFLTPKFIPLWVLYLSTLPVAQPKNPIFSLTALSLTPLSQLAGPVSFSFKVSSESDPTDHHLLLKYSRAGYSYASLKLPI